VVQQPVPEEDQHEEDREVDRGEEHRGRMLAEVARRFR
jgi:hypothetical protein